MTPLKPGRLAPDFDLETDAGERLSLKSLRGQTVVLYFYPKDDTTGCTQEACEFRDAFPRFKKSKAVILGISPDSPAKQKKFAEKFDLPFRLLSDIEHTVAEKYAVWKQKSMYGRTYMGIERSAFLIGSDGRIERAWYKISPKDTPLELLAALKK